MRFYSTKTKWMKSWDWFHSTCQIVCCFTWMVWPLHGLIGTNLRHFLDGWMSFEHFNWMQSWHLWPLPIFIPLRTSWWSSNLYVHFCRDVGKIKSMMNVSFWYFPSWEANIRYFLLPSTPPWMPWVTDTGCHHLRWLSWESNFKNMPRSPAMQIASWREA